MPDLELDITTQPGETCRWEISGFGYSKGMIGRADGGMISDLKADQQRSTKAIA